MNIRFPAIAAIAVAGACASAPVASADDVGGAAYGYSDFYDIPRLGTETVAGSGCGGDGSIGDTIPDGYWRGYVRGPANLATLEFDLVCVYTGDVDPDLVARWVAEHPGQPEPWVSDGFLVNNSTRTRTVTMAPGAVNHGSAWDHPGSCPFGQVDVPFDSNRDAWIHIVNGQAEFVVSSCFTPVATAPNPGTGFTFPYATFWEVPQLGTEPVLGTGCGADGSLGDTMPDGLWYGYIEFTSSGSLEFDVSCVYHGPVAEQKCRDFMATNPFGSPCFGMGEQNLWFYENNNERTRTVPTSPNYVAGDGEWVDNGDGSVRCVPTANVIPSNTGMGGWLYIEHGQAQYSLRECPHD